MCSNRELGRHTVVVNKENNMNVYPCSTYTVESKKVAKQDLYYLTLFLFKKIF